MFAQLLFNSFVSGLLLATLAVGFCLIFNTSKVFHLAHAGIYVCGAYAFLYFFQMLASNTLWNWVLASFFAILMVVFIAFIVEKVVYLPLSRRNANQAITLIASMGMYVFLVNLIALLFGNETKSLQLSWGNSIYLLNIIIVPVQAVQLIICVILLAFILGVSRTKRFLQVRALMSNETAASVLGVNIPSIRLYTIALGSVFAGIAGILRLLDTGIDPNAGMGITLSATVAVIIGGGGSLKGTITASLLIAFLQTTTEWFLSAQWKDGMTFLLLIFVILWRTEGIVSFKMRVEEK